MPSLLLAGGTILAYALLFRFVLLCIHKSRMNQANEVNTNWGIKGLIVGLTLLLVTFWGLKQWLLVAGQAGLLGLIAALVLVRRSSVRVANNLPSSEVSKAELQHEITSPSTSNLRKSWKKRTVISTIVIGLVVVGGFSLARVFGGPEQGSISYLGADKPKQYPKQIDFKGQSFDLKYPDVFRSSPLEPVRPPFLEHYEFLNRQPTTWDLAIAIESLPSGEIGDDGSYRFRQVNAQRFTQNIESIAGNQIYIMTDTQASNGFAKAGFFLHDGKLASVSLIGGSANDAKTMEQDFHTILASWQWK